MLPPAQAKLGAAYGDSKGRAAGPFFEPAERGILRWGLVGTLAGTIR